MYLIYRLGNLALSYSKLPKIKDAWTVQFECMHGVVGPRSLVDWVNCYVCGSVCSSILFCFLYLKPYRTYKIISSYELARPIMGTIFLVIIISIITCV